MRLLYIPVILLILVGCGASRRALQSDTQTAAETVTTLHVEATAEQSDRSSTQTDLVQNEEVITEIAEFDTSLPTDPTTGTPPITRKTTQIRRAITAVRQTEQADVQSAQKTIDEKAAVEKSASAAHAEEETRQGMNWMQTTLCSAGIFALLGVILWVLRRRL